MRRSTLFALLLLIGCGPQTNDLDAGAPLPDSSSETPDSGTDAGPAIDPLAASFVESPATGDGPWATWGYMAVPQDASHAIVLGGAGSSGEVFDTVWRVEVGPAGMSAEPIEAVGPRPRFCACAAYDRARDRVIIFGGRDLEDEVFAPETWELDLATSTWTEMPTPTEPTGTLGCAMTYSPSAERVYMFAGASRSGPVAGTFRYEDGAWVALDADGPSARYDAVFVPSHDGSSLYLFGGSYGARGSAFFADLWRFDPASESWIDLDIPGEPPGRRTAWVVVDPDREGLYIGFGYDGDMRPMGDLHYVDLEPAEGPTWREIEIPFEGPLPRGFAAALPGGDGALGALFGGFGGRRSVVESFRFVRP